MNAKISSFQSRLAMKQDTFKRKVIDNSNLLLVSNPVDCFRIRKKSSYRGDETGLLVESVDVVPIVFPALDDVPIQKIVTDEETQQWQLTGLVDAFEDGQEDKLYTIQAAYGADLKTGDLLVRVFLDEAQKVEAVLIMEIQNILGTFGGMKLIMEKFSCTIPTYQIPREIVDVVKQMVERRVQIAY